MSGMLQSGKRLVTRVSRFGDEGGRGVDQKKKFAEKKFLDAVC